MQFGTLCIECLVGRYARMARAAGDSETATRFLKRVMDVMVSAPEGVSAPFLTPKLTALTEEFYGRSAIDYEAVKKASNEAMLALLPELRQRLAQAEDPLRLALGFAATANYIDFTALFGQVELESLGALFPASELPDERVYRAFCAELARADGLLYVLDNAGEIFADRLVAEELQKRFPALRLTFAVRGKPSVNDALREDARLAGLDRLGAVIDNGSAISGTELGYLSEELSDALSRAPVVLAKGQGNFETMLSCGRNVYYLFLCKCKRFTDFFSVPLMTGLFVREQDLKGRKLDIPAVFDP